MRVRHLFLVLIATIISCKKPYLPPVINSSANYLVVEGVINSGQDSTIIKLSRTVVLSGKTTAKPELKASVTVENDQSAVYPLSEIGGGEYAVAALSLDNTRQYRLRIKTAGGKEYISDFAAVKINPPIDSVGFIVQNKGIQLYLNTHDPDNNTHYYRWDYKETWLFHAKYGSAYVTNGTAIVSRTSAQNITTCFGNEESTSILLGSSAKLKEDVIYQNPITQVAAISEKLESKYSILVKQYALTQDAYNFWVNLKRNTEQLGNIFDAQPSTANGNIHCITDPTEPVIGYISVTNVQQKRIFIVNSQLPQDWVPTYPYSCELDSAFFCRGTPCYQNDVAEFMIPSGSTEIPVNAIYSGPVVIGYLGSDRECADCTIRGVVKQPAFWK